MRFRWRRWTLRRMRLPGRALGRWLVVVCGLGVLVVALAGAAGPFERTREFREVSACEQGAGGCFDAEKGSIVARRTYTTTSTHTDANGSTTTTTTVHHEVTWQRADGSRRARDVPSSFYAAAPEGQEAVLQLWRGEVVGVKVMGAAAWFLPESGSSLRWWSYLAHLGVGVLLWGLLFGWWDGFFMLAFRLFCWMFLSVVPVGFVTHGLAYGFATGSGLVFEILTGAFFALVAGAMLVSTLNDW
ncbi:hypothetical protein GCM10011609_09210 [Lentzea pudingi]|uniref:DUF3592 domain-containing protein n=1 Tax=Lentzea pudingi TaxID=1789439 RepID=A0ABQ2HDS3_9PSEU|nr:hypothetical protein [Lentzea pudingi]GGM75436.1 hypothetical protein GCM10011609_09210 [Lentzea pudingi]